MKKFCSNCGNQLELSQRFCSECGDVNPFFIPAFTLLSDKSDELEKLRVEKERIETELKEKEQEQAEFIRQEELRRELEELQSKKNNRIDKEQLLREQAEREKIEANLQKEIQRIKEEAEKYKNQTVDLVKEIREELQQIEADNKKLKEELELINKPKPLTVQPTVETPPPVVDTFEEKEAQSSKGWVLPMAMGVLLLLGVLYFSFAHVGSKQSIENENAANFGQDSKHEAILKSANDSADVPQKTELNTTMDSSPVATETKIAEKKKETAGVTSSSKQETLFELTEQRIRKDLLGKKLSGCDIVINSSSDLKEINNIVFVEKLPTGYSKFKFSTKITQGKNSYRATPYLYYSANGSFVRIDGTNCE